MDDSSTEYYDSDTTDTESSETDIIYLEDETDEVYEREEELYLERTSDELNGKYFIGCYKYEPEENILLFVNRVHPTTFMNFSGQTISKYFPFNKGAVKLRVPNRGWIPPSWKVVLSLEPSR